MGEGWSRVREHTAAKHYSAAGATISQLVQLRASHWTGQRRAMRHGAWGYGTLLLYRTGKMHVRQQGSMQTWKRCTREGAARIMLLLVCVGALAKSCLNLCVTPAQPGNKYRCLGV